MTIKVTFAIFAIDTFAIFFAKSTPYYYLIQKLDYWQFKIEFNRGGSYLAIFLLF